jgi:E3 ubiquitin-protein ligase HECTD1
MFHILYWLYFPYFAGIEVNFMDDVGQTLLNWASAFGTQEMVEFLCDRGADVNKGKPAIPTHCHSPV